MKTVRRRLKRKTRHRQSRICSSDESDSEMKGDFQDEHMSTADSDSDVGTATSDRSIYSLGEDYVSVDVFQSILPIEICHEALNANVDLGNTIPFHFWRLNEAGGLRDPLYPALKASRFLEPKIWH